MTFTKEIQFFVKIVSQKDIFFAIFVRKVPGGKDSIQKRRYQTLVLKEIWIRTHRFLEPKRSGSFLYCDSESVHNCPGPDNQEMGKSIVLEYALLELNFLGD